MGIAPPRTHPLLDQGLTYRFFRVIVLGITEM